jgi:signal transduction histidine kinase
VVALWREAVAQQREFEVEHRLRRADGEYRWYLRRAILLGGGGGARGRWFGTCTDIHDLKLLQESLRQADRLKEDFLSMASHEFRTPLTALRLQAELLRQRSPKAVPTDERLVRPLSIMDRQIDRMEGLLGTLFDISRINAGKFTLELASMDLAELVGEVAERFRSEAEAAGTEIRVRLRSVLGSWDRSRLDQVITNLVGNAIKYGNRQPVEVEVLEQDGAAILVVRDRGIGIEPGNLPRLFDRFERGSNTTGIQGLGLGLWITRKVVEAHGGRVTVESAPDTGSTFTVVLPSCPPG